MIGLKGEIMFKNKVFVIDAAAIFTKYVLQLTFPLYTTPQIVDEVKDKKGREVLETIRITGRFTIRKPSKKNIRKIIALSKDMGEFSSLSEADISILALALDLIDEGKKPVIITDDYTVQNVAKSLGLSFQPIRTRGITEIRKYIIQCPACGYITQDKTMKYCPKCGHKLTKKPIKTS